MVMDLLKKLHQNQIVVVLCGAGAIAFLALSAILTTSEGRKGQHELENSTNFCGVSAVYPEMHG